MIFKMHVLEAKREIIVLRNSAKSNPFLFSK